MTKKQLTAEIAYHCSLSPFKKMLLEGVIIAEDYQKIDTILRKKYCPLFVSKVIEKSLDIIEK